MNTTTSIVTADDVAREDNILVILPWDGRVGEIWDDGIHRKGPDYAEHLYGIAGLNGSQVPERMYLLAPWAHIAQMYAWRGTDIRRAPEGAEPGDLV